MRAAVRIHRLYGINRSRLSNKSQRRVECAMHARSLDAILLAISLIINESRYVTLARWCYDAA
jgi:hypothetical protein